MTEEVFNRGGIQQRKGSTEEGLMIGRIRRNGKRHTCKHFCKLMAPAMGIVTWLQYGYVRNSLIAGASVRNHPKSGRMLGRQRFPI